ncbi:thiol reductant ABC exporter, CydC subunit [Mobiluncus mulieris ATCC 35239]|uniref:Thiol reductant ABC exporter, CydC subunit n=2 Tax=Mobiluncus mulieris TaxID=2052 RepID=E0QR48_9ACTO|nr:thiol reductant ABC exporter subunit CydC [Mobiluncus mulieris]EFM46041.1 thiol reductant ABC exporter, CydC subunit [Mobiluncus mulieris ATCC 35239]MCU9970079.1 thiol reductant ABC exporter subunit CydC [Mobiluncus mulieris]MCU9974538.1 thiol reductant ABC exporter subunit CydC [Mobiluncus mulieris]MCV0010839.1 thiol reductant ABC exporter subunit CydC [Mobiluncus mulieris]NMW61896.1 thiol reductant ABC exporter subunit CydC [Mobiluncus mulieris]
MNRLQKTTKKTVKVSPFMTRQEIRSLKLTYRMMHLKHGNMSLAIGLGVLTLVSAIGLSVIAAWMIARASQPDALWMDLAITAVCVRMFGIGRALFRYLERLASHKVALVGVANLRHTVYRILADRPTNNIAALRRGEILARTGGDVDSVGDFVVKSVLPVTVTAITGLGTVILFAFYSPLAALALALCLLLAGVVGPMLTIRSARIAELAAQHAQIELSASAQTLLMNAPELAVSGRLSEAKEHLESVEQDIQALKDQAARPAAIASFIDNFAMGLAVLCGFLIGTPLVLSGQLWDVNLAILVLAPLAAFEGTAQLAPAAVQLVSSGAATSRLVELMGGEKSVEAALERIQREDQEETLTASHPVVVIPSDEADTAGAKKSGSTAATDAASTVEIEPVLVAQDLAIGWPGGPVVAHGINLELRPGKALAVVGQSGIGKSTLLYTLAGLIHPVSGTLTLGGKPLSEIPREDVATTIIMTAEDAHIFQTSVLENIRVSRNNVGSVEAEKLMIQAGMGTWLQAAPRGLETTLGMDGAALSGGERRRILLARALASPARLLALDEPGEHLDGEMADQLVGDLLTTGKSGERGVLLVTHRLSALGAADEVLVMAKTETGGTTEVIARGTHAELVERQAEYRWALEQEKTYV